MSDGQLREADRRWRASRSSADEAALLTLRLRAGLLDEPRLRLAVLLGSEAAKLALPPGSVAAERTEPLAGEDADEEQIVRVADAIGEVGYDALIRGCMAAFKLLPRTRASKWTVDEFERVAIARLRGTNLAPPRVSSDSRCQPATTAFFLFSDLEDALTQSRPARGVKNGFRAQLLSMLTMRVSAAAIQQAFAASMVPWLLGHEVEPLVQEREHRGDLGESREGSAASMVSIGFGKVIAFAAAASGRVAVAFGGALIRTFGPSGAVEGGCPLRPGEDVLALSWLPDGLRLVSGEVVGGTPRLRLLDWRCRELASHTLPGRPESVCSTPDGEHVLWASPDGEVRVHCISNGQESGTLTRGDGVVTSGLIVSSQGAVAVATRSGVALHGLSNRRPLGGFETEDVEAMVFSPDGSHLLVGSRSSVQVRDVPRSKVTQTLVIPGTSKNDRVTSLAFSPAGVTLVVGLSRLLKGEFQSGALHALDPRNGTSRLSFETPEACLFLATHPDRRVVTSHDTRRTSVSVRRTGGRRRAHGRAMLGQGPPVRAQVAGSGTR